MVSSNRSSLEKTISGEPFSSGSSRVTTKLSPVQLSVIRRAVAEALDRPSPTLKSGRLIGSNSVSVSKRVEVILPIDYTFKLESPHAVRSELNDQQQICRKPGDVLTIEKGTKIKIGDGTLEVVAPPLNGGTLGDTSVRIFGDQLYLTRFSNKPIRFDRCPGRVEKGTIFSISSTNSAGSRENSASLTSQVSGDFLA